MSKATKVLILDEATVVDSSGAPVFYVGKAPIGTASSASVWKIQKIDTTSGVIVTYAGGGNYTQIWDNRTSLVYA